VEHGNEISSAINFAEFREWLTKYLLLKKDFELWTLSVTSVKFTVSSV
jgi:hypothetical protein